MIYTTEERAAELVAAGLENAPFALYSEAIAGATYTGSATIEGGGIANLISGATSKYWQPIATAGYAEAVFSWPEAVDCNAVGIAAHNLHTLGATVELEALSGNIWTGLGSATPTDGSPIVWRFSAAGLSQFRLAVSDIPSGEQLSIAVCRVGLSLVFVRNIYQGFAPRIGANQVELQSNVTEGGNYLGGAIVRAGSTVSASFDHLPASFARGPLRYFAEHFNAGKPFFWGWRPEKYPQDVQYCWRSGGVIAPENTGPRDLMSASFEARAYEHE